MQYYDDNKIACLQIQVDDFPDCGKIEEKLSHPNHMNICPNPRCKKCGEIMHHVQMVTVVSNCWKCGQEMKIAMLATKNGNRIFSPTDFSEDDVKKATTLGANIKRCYSKTLNEAYFANVCEHCNAFVGNFYMHEYYYEPHEKETDYYFKCLNCM